MRTAAFRAAQSSGSWSVFEVRMSRSMLRQVRRGAPLAVAAAVALTISSLPAMAQTEPGSGDCSAIQFELSNPAPGSRIDPGTMVAQGIALDAPSEDGPGIDRIDFFIGNPEQHGLLLGHAVPGGAEPFGPSAPTSFQTT